jgi:hypothetical protein
MKKISKSSSLRPKLFAAGFALLFVFACFFVWRISPFNKDSTGVAYKLRVNSSEFRNLQRQIDALAAEQKISAMQMNAKNDRRQAGWSKKSSFWSFDKQSIEILLYNTSAFDEMSNEKFSAHVFVGTFYSSSQWQQVAKSIEPIISPFLTENSAELSLSVVNYGACHSDEYPDRNISCRFSVSTPLDFGNINSVILEPREKVFPW